jgi:uncharacterized protein
MIRKDFSFIEGLTPRLRVEIENKKLSWDDFLNGDVKDVSYLDEDIKKNIISKISLAKKKLGEKDYLFFSKNFEKKNHYLLFEHFLDGACYLDIETTGLWRDKCRITTISVYDGKEMKTFIHGINMDEKEISKFLDKFKMIVTYNGIYFDVPFIEHKFPLVRSDNKLHADLRWACRKVGLFGGLKKIEKEVGITRGDDLEGVDGMMAVRLWKKYEKNGDEAALKLLVKYNQEDVYNLEKLAKIVMERLKEQK